ncbi:MAG: VOC family protein [Bryobacteraceae bacterium]|nr:VOC family protein [Bryobacteraceae bacterium]
MRPTLFRVIVPVTDVERAAKFYARVLGFEGERVSPGRHYFDCSTILACYDAAADGDGDPLPPLPEHIYIAVDHLEAVYRRAAEAGASWIEGGIETRPWGERSFYMKDPFGNPLCFVQRDTAFRGGREG